MIAGVFLAAGQSKRFGSSKLLHELDDRPLVQRSLAPYVMSRLPEIYVVVPARSPELEEAIGGVADEHRKITIVHNERSERGQMSSLKVGLRSLGTRHTGAMVCLADMPMVTVDLVDTLVVAFDSKNGIIIPECDGKRRHPRVIPRRFFSEFLALGDDERGSVVIERFHTEVVTVTIGDEADYVDVDYLEDIDRI